MGYKKRMQHLANITSANFNAKGASRGTGGRARSNSQDMGAPHTGDYGAKKETMDARTIGDSSQVYSLNIGEATQTGKKGSGTSRPKRKKASGSRSIATRSGRTPITPRPPARPPRRP